MTVFDVYVNGQRRCRAGGDCSVLTAICDWVRLSGPAARTARRLGHPVEESRLQVGGLSERSHVSWVDQRLRLGDRVEIVLARALKADRPRAREPRQGPPELERTSFLNVDLDIWSRKPLDKLVQALGRRVVTLYAGRDGRRHVAHLEMESARTDPDRLIRGFVSLIQRLPPRERRMWDSAERREFNLGIQAGSDNHELRLSAETVRATADVKASIGVTVYGVRNAGR